MHWLRSQFRTFHKIHRWWKNRLTIIGRSLALIAVACSPAIIIPDSSLTIFFASSFFLLLLSAIVAWLHSPKLNWTLVQSAAWRCLEPGVLQFQVENQGRLPVFDLHLRCQDVDGLWTVEILDPHISRLLAGETISIRVRLTPLRRGLHHFPRLRAESQFPLGIHRRQGSPPQLEKTLVYRAAAEPINRSFLEAGRSRATGKQQLAGHAGWNGDYVGSREYFPGMPVRRWDYGSWARLGRPVVREFSNPQRPQAKLLLDFHQPVAGTFSAFDAMESVISVAGELSQTLIGLGFQISCIRDLDEALPGGGSKSEWTTDEIEQFLALIPHSAQGAMPYLADCDSDSPGTWTLVLTCSKFTDRKDLWESCQGSCSDISLCVIQPARWPTRKGGAQPYLPPAITDILHREGVFR